MSQTAPTPSWKEEVNRRLEEHKNRRGIAAVDNSAAIHPSGTVSDRAAQAAARVAARYAKAPSYSEMQATEARAALRKAEAATRAALEAQAEAQAKLAGLEAVQALLEEVEEREEESRPFAGDRPMGAAVTPAEPVQARWNESLPVQTSARDIWNMPGPIVTATSESPVEVIEPAQPIHANLIQFPRELVATRRMRPRLSGASVSQSGELFGQLSIFEVDPETVSTEPLASIAEAAAPPSWTGPEWSSIELDALQEDEWQHEDEQAACAPGVHLAPLELRLIGTVVDLALIIAFVCAAVFGIAGHLSHPPVLRVAEVAGVGALVLTGLLYQAFFLLVMHATPGMMYAGLALCTFDDERPTHAQIRDRLGALFVSLLPVGLGLAWAVFDEEHLSWHDRLSRTYLRRC
ncbi:MAG TPA: RDD family protein [Terracidiphilus sp.]|nr:RDD family protein [Terracidiphilus sp.]